MSNETENYDCVCNELDGCPTEGVVLKRDWRRHKAEILQLQEENEQLRDTVDGLRAGIADLARLCECEDEPRFKWIRLHITNLKDGIAELKEQLIGKKET